MKKIIIDCDPGIDDCLALLLAMQSKELDIVGITIVSGNIEVHAAAENAFQVLQLTGKENIPVHKGAAVPLARPFHDATDTHGRDGLGETFLPPTGLQASDTSAIDFILDQAEKYPHEITLVALGPLTNVALAIQKNKETMSLLKEIVLMGGADQFHGNCSPVAEYNFWVDPEAADEVFQSKICPITMVGLDVTHQIILSPNLREVIRQLGGKFGKFIHAITRFYVDFHWMQERTLGCVINDPLVIAMLLDENLVQSDPAYVRVETQGIANAQSVCDPFGKRNNGITNATVAHTVNPRRFFETFLNRLFPHAKDDIQLSLDHEFGKR